jgi:hypothetical protein
MQQVRKLIAAFCIAAATFPAVATEAGAIVGGADYAPQYDFSEFFAATDGKRFRVVTAGNPFPSIARDEAFSRLLPVMQANRPRPRLTFTYEKPVEMPRPDYRMVLVFDPANDLGAQRVCDHQFRHKPPTRGMIYVFAVYCRSEQPLSQTTAWTEAFRPEDPRVGQMFGELFLVLFTELPLMHRRGPFPFGFGR